MGRGVAASLRRAGYNVQVCDVRPGAAAEFVRDGGVAWASPAEVAAAAPVVICVVVNAAQTEDVLFGTGGCAASMPPGTLLIKCSTVDPAFSVSLEQRLEERGILYLDAPMSGGRGQGGRWRNDNDDVRQAGCLRRV